MEDISSRGFIFTGLFVVATTLSFSIYTCKSDSSEQADNGKTIMEVIRAVEAHWHQDDTLELQEASFSARPAHRAYKTNIIMVYAILSSGIDVNVGDSKGRTALHDACWFGRPKLAELLLENGANVDAIDVLGTTPLHSAVRTHSENIEIVQLLLKSGANIEARAQKGGEQPIHWVYRSEISKDITTLLLSHGVDINARDAGGKTPLHHAAPLYHPQGIGLLGPNKRHNEYVDYLISIGADRTIKDNSGKTPFPEENACNQEGGYWSHPFNSCFNSTINVTLTTSELRFEGTKIASVSRGRIVDHKVNREKQRIQCLFNNMMRYREIESAAKNKPTGNETVVLLKIDVSMRFDIIHLVMNSVAQAGYTDFQLLAGNTNFDWAAHQRIDGIKVSLPILCDLESRDHGYPCLSTASDEASPEPLRSPNGTLFIEIEDSEFVLNIMKITKKKGETDGERIRRVIPMKNEVYDFETLSRQVRELHGKDLWRNTALFLPNKDVLLSDIILSLDTIRGAVSDERSHLLKLWLTLRQPS